MLQNTSFSFSPSFFDISSARKKDAQAKSGLSSNAVFHNAKVQNGDFKTFCTAPWLPTQWKLCELTRTV
jgi:hypothetical protein